MNSDQAITVTLPADLLDRIHRKVRSGTFASPSEAVREGLEALIERDQAIDSWLQNVVAGHAEYLADPSGAVPAKDILKRIKQRRSNAG